MSSLPAPGDLRPALIGDGVGLAALGVGEGAGLEVAVGDGLQRAVVVIGAGHGLAQRIGAGDDLVALVVGKGGHRRRLIGERGHPAHRVVDVFDRRRRRHLPTGGITVGVVGQGGDHIVTVGGTAGQAVGVVTRLEADGLAACRRHRDLDRVMLGVVLGMRHMAERIGDIGEAEQAVVGVGDRFGQGIGLLDDIAIAVVGVGGLAFLSLGLLKTWSVPCLL